MSTSDQRDPMDPDDSGHDPRNHDEGGHGGAAPDDLPRREPGGPYFGRLLIVLLLAVVFCGVMTWYLSSVMTN